MSLLCFACFSSFESVNRTSLPCLPSSDYTHTHTHTSDSPFPSTGVLVHLTHSILRSGDPPLAVWLFGGLKWGQPLGASAIQNTIEELADKSARKGIPRLVNPVLLPLLSSVLVPCPKCRANSTADQWVPTGHASYFPKGVPHESANSESQRAKELRLAVERVWLKEKPCSSAETGKVCGFHAAVKRSPVGRAEAADASQVS